MSEDIEEWTSNASRRPLEVPTIEKETPENLDEVNIIRKQNICMYFSFQSTQLRYSREETLKEPYFGYASNYSLEHP